jgi:hypothetical protein
MLLSDGSDVCEYCLVELHPDSWDDIINNWCRTKKQVSIKINTLSVFTIWYVCEYCIIPCSLT